MRRDEALRIIRAHEAELRAMRVESVELFGSVARDEAKPDSDVDVLVKFEDRIRRSGWDYAPHLLSTKRRFSEFLHQPVDLSTLPIQGERFARELEGERVKAY